VTAQVGLLEVVDLDAVSVDPQTLAADTPYVGLEHLTTGGGIASYSSIGGSDVASNKFKFDARHVLLGKLRPSLRKVGRPEHAGVCSTDIYPLRPGKRVDRNYLNHFLLHPLVGTWLADRATGANLPRISRSTLSDLQLPLPPLDEQRRIAAILDQADELRVKRRRTLALLDEMQEAAFSSHFDPSATIFRVEQVGQHVSLRSGKFLPRKAMSPGEVPVFGGNGVNGHHNVAMFSEPKIVVGRVGAQCGAVHVTPERSWVTDNAMVCTWDASALRLDYLADALRFARLNQFAATTDLRQLSASRVAAVPLAVPPLAVQDRYIAIVQRLGGARRSAEAHLARLDELFASLQHRAFTGQL